HDGCCNDCCGSRSDWVDICLGQKRGRVGADGVEAGKPEIDHAGLAPLDVEGEAEQGRERDEGQNGYGVADHRVILAAPNIPRGRNKSTSTRMRKLTPCR